PSRSQQPTISQAEYQQWGERLQKDGPRVQANDEYRWFEVDNPEEFKGSAEQYNDRDYVLASIRPEDSLDQRTGKWALTSPRPAQLNSEPISERTVGPQLGEDNLHKGLFACGLGLVVVAIFLIGYYHLSGVIAFFAIILNIILILGCMAAINATFTLPGIAA